MPDDVLSRLSGLGLEDEPPDDPFPRETQQKAPYFTGLGHNRGLYYFATRGGGQVLELTARDLANGTVLCQLAPLIWWETNFPGKESFNARSAANAMIALSYEAGIYDPERVRGRGAWLDDGRSVLHLGDHLLVEGSACDLRLQSSDRGSRYVYEAAKPLLHHIEPALTTQEAHRLVEICRMLRWERGISGLLLAGFVAVAPVCGGLSWRPSVWVTGSKGTGKSFVAENIVAPAMGRIALQVQSVTTEPALRRALGSDARPVLFDEAEQEGLAATTRMQAVLALVRQSSSEGGGDILKATQGDGLARFRVRSSFCFFSINVGIEHAADESRITVLALRSVDHATSQQRRDDDARFQALCRIVADTLTPGFSAALLARSVRLLPVIRDNAETFARAVAMHFGSRRLGDQLGSLLAGAYSLHSERRISLVEAEAFVQREEWKGATEEQDRSDERRLLDVLTQARVGISPGGRARVETSIGRLLAAVYDEDDGLEPQIADHELRQIGIRVGHVEQIARGFYISNTHPEIRRLLRGSPWASGWHRALARVPGAEAADNPVRFGPGHKARAVWIPWEAFEEVES